MYLAAFIQLLSILVQHLIIGSVQNPATIKEKPGGHAKEIQSPNCTHNKAHNTAGKNLVHGQL